MAKRPNRIVNNFFYHTIYQIFTILAPLVTTPYVSRVLHVEGVGQYSYYHTLVQYFVIAGTVGFSCYGQIKLAGVQDSVEERSKNFWEIFFLRLIFCSVSAAAYLCLSITSAQRVLMLILFGLLPSSILDISWLYFGLDDFRSVSIRNVAVKLASIVGIFIFVKDASDVPTYAFLLTSTTFLGSIAMWFSAPKLLCKPDWKNLQFRPHIKPAFEFFLPTIAVTIYTMADKTMIGLITKSDIQNGLYEQAYKIEHILIQFLLSIGVIYRSTMAKYHQEHNTSGMKDCCKSALTYVILAAFPMCFGLIAVSDNLVGWFLGDGYEQCVQLLIIFAFLFPVIGVSNCISNMYLSAVYAQKQSLIGTVSGAVINVCCNAILIPLYGASGAAFASLIGESVILVLFYSYAKEYFHVSLFRTDLLQALTSSIIMAACVLQINRFLPPARFTSLLAAGITGACTYVVLLLCLKNQTVWSFIIKIKKLRKS